MAVHLIHRRATRSELRHRWPADTGLAWLAEDERETYGDLSDGGRREAWLFGRLLAKQAILEDTICLAEEGGHITPSDIRIYSRDGLGRPTRPRLFAHGRARPWSLSIAHSHRSVFVALSSRVGWSVGVDLMAVQPLSDAFIELWYTTWEQIWLRRAGMPSARRASELWAIKEAAYKAINKGERFTPGRVEVRVRAPGEYDLRFDGAAAPGGARVHVAEADGELAAMVVIGADDLGEVR